MANSDVLVRLKADTKNYDANMAKASRQLDQFKKDNLSIGGVMKQASTAMVGMAAQFMTIGAAVKVAGEALKKNELIMDEWGRTTQSASAVFDSFVNSLNTSDFSGFFQNIRNVVSAARQAYDALDELSTFNAFNQINVQRAQTGFTEAITNFREGKGKIGDVRAAAKTLQTELGTRMEKENKAYVDAIRELAAKRGVDADMLMQALSGTYGSYEELKNTPLTGKKTIYHAGAPGQAGYATEVAVAATEQERLGQMLKRLSDEELNDLQALGAQAQRTATEIAQIDKQVARVSGKSGGGGGKGQEEAILPEGSAAALKKQIAELQDAWNNASTQDERNSIKGQIDAATEALKAMTPQIEPVAAAIKDAAAMWTEHSEKIENVKARLAEFQAMMSDESLSNAQREWAAGMAESYQEQLDKMVGATEEAANNMSNSLKDIPTQFDLVRESLDKFGSGIGAVSTLGNALDNLKNIGEDLAAAFSGEMDAWDALMTVFNSGIGIMDTVVSVMEAINMLQELSATLSEQRAAKQGVETMAVVGGKQAESQANIQEAGTSLLSAGADASEASVKAGKSVAWIPIVGPILAVAAIASVLGATLAAMSKAKSAGHFATGGIVPGNDYSDNTPVFVSSGELILNRAQQSNLAGQLQGGSQGGGASNPYVTGENIVLGVNNFLGRSGQGEIVTTSMLRRAGINL